MGNDNHKATISDFLFADHARELFAEIDGVEVFSVPNQDYFANYWLSAITIDTTKTNGITSETLRPNIALVLAW